MLQNGISCPYICTTKLITINRNNMNQNTTTAGQQQNGKTLKYPHFYENLEVLNNLFNTDKIASDFSIEQREFINGLNKELALKLGSIMKRVKQGLGKNDAPINVLISGDAWTGKRYVEYFVNRFGVRLKSLPYGRRYHCKQYEGKGIYIISSDMSVDEIKKIFPRDYTDIIVINPSETDKLTQHYDRTFL